ncbi:hypothetical protein VNO77_18492 [Canavalia gladiata]|uniref:TF-B3 domain-containing protein n=1 Tax=Canavalia gladiata TaxID=3824 RepID=A0AAN9LLM1_CANGL
MADTLSTQHKQIPKSFTKFFNGITPCKATLVDHDRNSWDIHLEKIEDRLVFKSGWEQFAKEKGLEEGDFLVFQYDDKSTFYVKIFSRTGCRKVAEAPASCAKSLPIVNSDEHSVPTCNKTQRGRKRKHPPTGLKINEKSMSEGPSEGARSKSRGVYEENDNRHEKKPDPAECVSLPPGCVPLQNPHFEIYFSPWKLNRVEIPRGLLRKLNITMSPEINLRDEKNRLWPVKIMNMEEGTRKYLGAGWSNFRKGNNIEEGHLCDFELVIDKANVVKELLVRLCISKCSN